MYKSYTFLYIQLYTGCYQFLATFFNVTIRLMQDKYRMRTSSNAYVIHEGVFIITYCV